MLVSVYLAKCTVHCPFTLILSYVTCDSFSGMPGTLPPLPRIFFSRQPMACQPSMTQMSLLWEWQLRVGLLEGLRYHLFYLFGCFACMHVCIPLVCLVLRGQKKASDSLALQLQKVVNYYVGSGNRTWVRCKSSKCSSPLNHLSNYNTTYFSNTSLKLVLPYTKPDLIWNPHFISPPPPTQTSFDQPFILLLA